MTTGVVTATIGLNVRQQPNKNSRKVTLLSYNESVKVLGEKNGWYEVSCNGKTGYVYGQYLSVSGGETAAHKDSETSSGSGAVYKTTANLNVRKGPGTNYGSIGVMKSGTQVTALGEENGWLKFKYNGQVAYSSMKFLKATGQKGSVDKAEQVAKHEPAKDTKTEKAADNAPKSSKKLSAEAIEDCIDYNNRHNGYCCNEIQAFLGVKQTDKFNATTINAIVAWQDKNGLDPDGYFGSKSMAKATKQGLKIKSSYTPGGNNMTSEMCKGLPLSIYHVGVSKTSANNERWRLHPTLQSKLEKLDALLAQEKMPFSLFEGMRSPVRQDYCKANGTSKCGAWAGNHNYGLAADYVDTARSWNTKKYDYQKLGKLGKSVGLEWGGDWKSFVDVPHFQLPNAPSASECKELYKKGGIDAVWSKF